MEKRKIRVLHLVRDDKFIEGTLKWFEDDGRFVNQCVMIVNSSDYQFKLISNPSSIKLLYNKQLIKQEFQREDYDVVFFFALTDYHIINYIPQDKIVIWWAWGYDIYGPERFINIPLYKPQTLKYLNNREISIVDRVKRILKNIPFVLYLKNGSRKKAIARIDYFQPVLHIEYLLMKRVKGFRAHEFYYYGGRNNNNSFDEEIPIHGTNILIGHCASDTNNHIDVWESVKNFIPAGTSVYLPISYGDHIYADYLCDTIVSDSLDIEFIKDFLPKDEYFNILDSCGYAIFGVLREQAIGNILRCLLKGIKVFLYKDSIPYQYYKEIGCEVYAIEEISEESFKIPMTLSQVRQNQLCLKRVRETVSETRETAINEIMDRLNKQ